MNHEKLTLIDASGEVIAEFMLKGEEDGWLSGHAYSLHLSAKLKEALDWYDEVVENQMLSYLDQALAAVEQFKLCVRYPNGASRKVFSLHINKENEVTFRLAPVPPPARLSTSESA